MDKVVHFEVPVDNLERAQDFYKNIFGWQVTEVPGMPYWIIHTVETDEQQMPKESGAINGGFFKKEEGENISPVIVINVPDIDEYIKNIEQAGGKVVLSKNQVGDFGLYARFTDTEGNIVGIWQDLK
jgi:predicted enzyme related to lactoylglutathione lyase